MEPTLKGQGFPDSSAGKETPAIQETLVRFLGQEDPLEKELPTPVFLGFPRGSVGKESACNVGDLGLIPVLGKNPWRGLQSTGSQRVGHD